MGSEALEFPRFDTNLLFVIDRSMKAVAIGGLHVERLWSAVAVEAQQPKKLRGLVFHPFCRLARVPSLADCQTATFPRNRAICNGRAERPCGTRLGNVIWATLSPKLNSAFSLPT